MKKYFLLLLPVVFLLAEVDVYGMQNSNKIVVPNSLEGDTVPSFAELQQRLSEPWFLKQNGSLLLFEIKQAEKENRKRYNELSEKKGEKPQLPTNISEQPTQKKRNINKVTATTTTTTNTPFVEEQGGASSSSSSSIQSNTSDSSPCSTLMSDSEFLSLIEILQSGRKMSIEEKQQTLKKLFDGARDSMQRLNAIINVFAGKKKLCYVLDSFTHHKNESEDFVLKHITNKKNKFGYVQLRVVLNLLFTKIGLLSAGCLNDKIKYYAMLYESFQKCFESAGPLCLEFIQNVAKIIKNGSSACYKSGQVLQIEKGLKDLFEKQTDLLLPQNQQLLVPVLTRQVQAITSMSASASSNLSKEISHWWANDRKSLNWDQNEWDMRGKHGFRQKLIAEFLINAGDSAEKLNAIKEMLNTHIPLPKPLLELIFNPIANSQDSVFQEVLNKDNKTGLLQLKLLLEILNNKVHFSVDPLFQEKHYESLLELLGNYINNSIKPEFLDLIAKFRDVISENINKGPRKACPITWSPYLTIYRTFLKNNQMHSLHKISYYQRPYLPYNH